MRYPFAIKTALNQVLQGPPPAHPGSMKAQQDAAAAAAAAGIVPGEEQAEDGEKDAPKEKTAGRPAKAGLPVTAKAKAPPGVSAVLPAVPAPGAVAAPKTEAPKTPVACFCYPLTKTAQIAVTRRQVEPSAPRTDFQMDRPMGVGETLATQLSNSLGAQMQPHLSPMDPTVSRPAHPLKHLV